MSKFDDISDTKELLELLGRKYAVDILLFLSKNNGAIWTEIRDDVVGKRGSGDTITKRLNEMIDEDLIKKVYVKNKNTNGHFFKKKGKKVVKFIIELHNAVGSKKQLDLSEFSP